MNEPVTFYMVSPEVMRYSIKFPSGKILLLKKGETYTTEDKEEQDFLTRQKYLAAKKLDDKEFRMWATLQFNKLPTVYNKAISEPKDVEEFVWSSEFENAVVKKLKERGYIAYKSKKGETK
ncbi:MAG: hypothetical protein WC179_09075 [Candidatus Cloacimonadaceae bacterium]